MQHEVKKAKKHSFLFLVQREYFFAYRYLNLLKTHAGTWCCLEVSYVDI